jgi:arsenite-transporting ATPase
LVFIGGKGGVGKTTVATALAGAFAGLGLRTLLVSTDPAHSTGDLLSTRLGDEPTRIAERFDAVEIDAERIARAYVDDVRRDLHGIVAQEVRPAIDRHLDLAAGGAGTLESALLDRLGGLISLQPSAYDRIVVDTAPTGHMLRLLAMPDVLERWIHGLVRQREGVRGVDRMLDNMVGSTDHARPDPVLDRLRAQRGKLSTLRHRLAEDAVMHAVMIPERLPIEETVRALPALRAAGIHVGCVVVNRLLPEDADGDFLRARREQQDAYLAEIHTRLAGERIVHVRQQPHDVSRPEDLVLLRAALTELLAVS